MRSTVSTSLLAALAVAVPACTADPGLEPLDPPVEGKADDFTTDPMSCSFANPELRQLTPRFAAVDPTSLAGMRPIEGIPYPRIGHDAEGYFYPPRRILIGDPRDEAAAQIADYLDELGFDSTGFRTGRRVGIPSPYVEGGTFASAAAPPASTLRVGMWNIARGAELETVIAEVERMDADVWIINESDLYGRSAGGRVVARELARALGYAYVTSGEFYELRDDRRGLSGNAIISRYPLSTMRTIYLPIYDGRDWAKKNLLDPQLRCSQRSALSADVVVPLPGGGSRPVSVVSAHLENMADAPDRAQQLRTAQTFLARPGVPTVLGGDFNTLGLGEGAAVRERLELAQAGTAACGTGAGADPARCEKAKDAGFPFTFTDCSRGDDTDTFPLGRIDWLLAQEAEGLSCTGYRVATEARGSDHKPVLVTVKLQ